MRSLLCLLLRLAALVSASIASHAAAQSSIKVLWYRYASSTSHYSSVANLLAAKAHLFQQSSGVRWELSFFGPGDPAPEFSRYNVLVIESGEAFRTGPNRNSDLERATPDYSGILRNRAAIIAARGDRTFISATDGDLHALRGDSGAAAPDDMQWRWDGARGHFINAVNWAGSGKGLGIVAWCDCEFPGAAWWQHADSFLRDELAGRVKYFRDNAPIIPDPAARLYLHHGLTSKGLSNWHVSFHGGFRLPLPGYTPLILSSSEPGYALAIASSATAAAPAGPNPTLQFVLDRVQVDESDRRVGLSIARSGNAIGEVSVNYTTMDGTALAKEDYLESSGSVVFENGELGAKSIWLEVVRDNYAEGAEHFTVSLNNPTNAAVLGAQTRTVIEIADAGGNAPPAQTRAATAAPAKGGCSLQYRSNASDPTLCAAAVLAWLRLRRKPVSTGV